MGDKRKESGKIFTSEDGGHSKTSTTTDIYSHIIKKADTEAADKLDDLFNPASRKNIK